MNSSDAARRRMNDYTYGSGGERLAWSYYDKVVLADVVTDFIMFQLPVGSVLAPGVQKTLADTNMRVAGQIPSNQGIVIRVVQAAYLAHATHTTADIDTLYNFFRVAVIEIRIDGKDAIYQRPLVNLLGFPVLFHSVPGAAGPTENIFSMGRGLGIDPINIPIPLGPQSHFEVHMIIPAALGAANTLIGDELLITLSGGLDRLN